MSQRLVDQISGLIGTLLLVAFVVGLAESISSGAAGFWGGLPFWVIVIACLLLVAYEYWETYLRKP